MSTPEADFLETSGAAAFAGAAAPAVEDLTGARGAWIEWQVGGVLDDPEMLRQVVIGWLADDRPPA